MDGLQFRGTKFLHFFCLVCFHGSINFWRQFIFVIISGSRMWLKSINHNTCIWFTVDPDSFCPLLFSFQLSEPSLLGLEALCALGLLQSDVTLATAVQEELFKHEGADSHMADILFLNSVFSLQKASYNLTLQVSFFNVGQISLLLKLCDLSAFIANYLKYLCVCVCFRNIYTCHWLSIDEPF